MRLLGIDPGQNTGLAIYEAGILTELVTTTPYGALAHLHAHHARYDLIAIEDSRCQSALFSVEGEKIHAKALKIARDVGRIDALCALIAECCAAHGVPIVQISPKTKGAKLDAEEFREVTGWAAKSNQHERDAAMVGWIFRRANPAHFKTRQADLMVEFGTRRTGKRVKKQS